MVIGIKKTERAAPVGNAILENHTKDSRKGVISLLAGAFIGLVGIASAGISAKAGYTSIHYIHSYFHPPRSIYSYFHLPKSELKNLNYHPQKIGFRWFLSNQVDPEYERIKESIRNTEKCALVKEKLEAELRAGLEALRVGFEELQDRFVELQGGLEKKEEIEKILTEYRKILNEDHTFVMEPIKRKVRDFLSSYEKGEFFNCKPEFSEMQDFCKQMNLDQKVINPAPPITTTINKLAQTAWDARGDLSLCLEEDPLNAATAGVLITASVVATYASYRLFKKAFSS